MSLSDQTLDAREKELSSRIQTLERQLERLSARMPDEEGARNTNPGPTIREREYPAGELSDVSEEVLNWAGRTALLPRLATLCFLLVVALMLRTVTDSGVINKLIGSGIGMSYATILMILGWYNYNRQSPLAPVFAASGAILMSTIVVETHAHFKSLPLVPAYLTLMATGIGMALISRRFNAFTPISVGILGMCLAGAAIDYPHPYFPYLSLLLFTANLLGYFAAQLKRCSWLRWSVLLVTIAMLQLWGVQIVSALRGGGTVPPELLAAWFFPVITLFAATYLALALLGLIRGGTDTISRFDLSLPTLNVLWAFSIALYVTTARNNDGIFILGIIGVLIAIGHLAVSFWLAQRNGQGAYGAAAYTFACGVLLALALPAATGRLTLSLPILSLIAIFMAVMSRVWNSGTVRITTYLFHIYCSVALVYTLRGEEITAMDAVNILPAGLLACIIFYQYLWCRWWPPAEDASFFSQFDHKDRSAVLLLVAGLICGFFMIRVAIFQTLQIIPAAMHQDIFRCSQSVFINGGAVALVLFAYLRRDKEIRNVAILVTLVGGVKVFLFDLLGTHGIALVSSVFSFGMAAAIESVALGKWQKPTVDKAARE